MLVAVDDGASPGFSDGLSAGWDVLAAVLSVAVVALGALVPFVWVFVVIGALIWWARRRRREPAGPGPSSPVSAPSEGPLPSPSDSDSEREPVPVE